MNRDKMPFNKQLSTVTFGAKKPPPSFTELRIVLLGKTGSGKSSTANSILGRKAFDSTVDSSSVTRHCRRANADVRGQHLVVVDTPGLLDTHQTLQDVQRELRKSVSLLYPGPHVFLLVIHIGRFTQEEKEAVRQFKQTMGSKALDFAVVVFSNGDLLQKGTSVKECLIDRCKDLAELVDECGGRYCVFNNHISNSKDKGQVCELLTIVDAMMQGNEGSCYTSKILQKAEEELELELQEERRLQSEKEELERKRQEAEIRGQYEGELGVVLHNTKKVIEQLKRKQELERQKDEKLVRQREKAFRQEIGESNRKEKEERELQEMMRIMEIHQEEEKKREALQEKLDAITKTLEEQAKQEVKNRRAMEEKMQRDRAENRMKEEALQKQLEKLTATLEEQRRKEEQERKQMEDMLRDERVKNMRGLDKQMETQRAEKRKTEALEHQLKLVKTKMEQHRAHEEGLKQQLEERLQSTREKYVREISELQKQCEQKCAEMSEKAADATSARKPCVFTTVTGYAQEMGLVGLNVALGSIGVHVRLQ